MRKELIYRDKSRNAFVFNELVNFSGTDRLRKTMRKSDWLSMKYPDEPLMRTKEYMPTACQLDMVGDGREGYSLMESVDLSLTSFEVMLKSCLE